MTHFRAFRNTDPPALVKLWNQTVPQRAAARPLRVNELDAHALGSVLFEAAGLIVAEKDGRIVGFAHAGFGPDQPIEAARPLEVSRDMGTIAMLIVEPGLDDLALVTGLISAAEAYLRDRGAKVLYAGSLFPLNPFYWGLSGGSEGAGVLSAQRSFQNALLKLGYQPAAVTVLMEADLGMPQDRDPRAAIIRRQTEIEFVDDSLPANWWQNLALDEFPTLKTRLLARADGALIASAHAWDMGWFSRVDSRLRIGLFDVEVKSEYRRKGFGRFVVNEIFRRAREAGVLSVAVQTAATNAPALAFYASLGFEPVDEATLYRLPAGLSRG